MDYKKKIIEYRKSIGATTTSTMRTAVLRDSTSTINESGNQLNFSQQILQSQKHSQNGTLSSVKEDDNVIGNRRNNTREYRKSIEAAKTSSIIRTVSFQDTTSHFDKADKQKETSQLNFESQQSLQYHTLFSIEGDSKNSTGTGIPSHLTRKVLLPDSPTSLDNIENKNNSPLLNVQPQQRQQSYELFEVDEDSFNSEDTQSTTRELSVLRVSSPSAQRYSLQSMLPNPGYHREISFLLEPVGRYVNWNSHHAILASQPWVSIGDLMALCDKYEFKAVSVSDVQAHANIVSEVRSLLSGKAPFDMRRRFPGIIRNTEKLFVCIGRCPSVEYHLERILTAFRRPLNKLSIEKLNIIKQNLHLAVRELHLDISARISEIKLYDRNVFEREFHLNWQDNLK